MHDDFHPDDFHPDDFEKQLTDSLYRMRFNWFMFGTTPIRPIDL